MSQTIGEVNISLRMSLAQFKQDVKAGTSAATDASKGMADAVGKSSHEAKASIALLGEEIGVSVPRHLRTFITQVPAIGSALSSAFSAIAVVALAEVVVKSIEKIKELATEIGGFGKEAQEAWAKFVEGNKQALKFAEDLRQKYRELALIGLTGGAKEAKQREIDLLSRTEAQEQLNKGLERQREIELELAEEDKKAALATASGTAVLGYLGDKLGITEDKAGGLKKELAQLGQENQLLAQAVKSTGLKGQRDDLEANAAYATRAADAMKKLSEILFKVRQEKTKLQITAGPNAGIPDLLGNQDAFHAIRPQAPPSFNEVFGPAIQKQNEAVLKDAANVYEQTRNNAEKYAEELDHLDGLLHQGVITQDTYNRAVIEAKNKFDDSTIAARQFGADIMSTIKTGALFGRSWKDALSSIAIELTQLILKMTLFKSLSTASSAGGGGFFSSLLSGLFTAKAAGGPVYQGAAYMVGEQGPEAFVPDTSGRIIPNNTLRQSGADKPTVVNNHFTQVVNGVTDADSFKKSAAQISADMLALMAAAAKRNR